jgi:hypothetical protein
VIEGEWQRFKILEISNVNGQVLFSEIIDSEVIEIFKKDLVSGFYFVKLKGEAGQIVRRIVVE